MKRAFMLLFLVAAVAFSGYGQGQFVFVNPTAPSRVGSTAGPLAGTNIWAHMLAGASASALEPLGPSLPHGPDGLVHGGGITVPGIPQGGYAYAQMLAWDATLWGTSLAGVPAEQLGATDVVRVFLGGSAFPINPPAFTQPAIVPVPEPSLLALAGLAGMAALLLWRSRTTLTGQASSLSNCTLERTGLGDIESAAWPKTPAVDNEDRVCNHK